MDGSERDTCTQFFKLTSMFSDFPHFSSALLALHKHCPHLSPQICFVANCFIRITYQSYTFINNFSFTFYFVVFCILLTTFVRKISCYFYLLLGIQNISVLPQVWSAKGILFRIVVRNGYILYYLLFWWSFRLLCNMLFLFNNFKHQRWKNNNYIDIKKHTAREWVYPNK